MKILKGLLFVIFGVVALVLIAAAVVKKDYSVEREVTVNLPKAEVFDYVKYLKNQDKYSTWQLMDPDMKKEFKGTDGTVGFVATWDSDHPEVGRGEQEIIKITEGERIDFELRFFEPFEATEPAYMITEAVSPTETKVKWGFHGHMDYPMNLMIPLMNMEEMIGNDLEKGLTNLKGVLEQ
ncbi:SRPBCC family protein [Flammeovirgaceae bacterium SG7u.111]|nr:SRPBCC family protein [Flammeovirgaceae bacterium SG7u.132]WPO36384.1 SRPBCC family protein [Flammeovirgaceae bacterium SG7u.111]